MATAFVVTVSLKITMLVIIIIMKLLSMLLVALHMIHYDDRSHKIGGPTCYYGEPARYYSGDPCS